MKVIPNGQETKTTDNENQGNRKQGSKKNEYHMKAEGSASGTTAVYGRYEANEQKYLRFQLAGYILFGEEYFQTQTTQCNTVFNM